MSTMQSENSILVIVNNVRFLQSHRSEILQKLYDENWNVDVLSLTSPDSTQSSHPHRFVYKFRYVLSLMWHIVSSQHSVIHVISPKAIILFLLIRIFRKNKNVLLAFSGFGFIKSIINTRYRFIFYFGFKLLLMRFAGILLVQNDDDKEICEWLGVKSDKIKIIRGSGFNFEAAEKNGYLAAPAPKTTQFLFASRLLKSKGVLDFVAAANLMHAAGSSSEFIIAGGFDHNNPSAITEEQFESIRASKIVSYIGEKTDVLAQIVQSSCVVLPSTYGEGLPKILIEAACLGRSIITTDLAGCRDAVINEETGLLVEPENVLKLVEAMSRLERSPEVAIVFGQKAKTFGKAKFDVIDVVDKHMQIYRSLTDD